MADAGAGNHTLSLEFRTQDTGALRRAAQNLVISGEGGSENIDGDGGNSGDAGGEDDGEDDDAGSQPDSAAFSPVVIDYIVQPGDTLWRISARFFGNGSHWKQLYMDNHDEIRDPNRIHTGQRLRVYLTNGRYSEGTINMVPGMAVPDTRGSYTVQRGDNLWKIAGKVYGKTGRWGEIYEANRGILSDPGHIYVKQVLIIP